MTAGVTREVERRSWLAAGDRERGSSWAIGCVLVTLATLLFVLFVPATRHWFVIPVTFAGILVSVDAVDWVRKRCDVFDPQAMIGLLGTHFFFLAPLLHVTSWRSIDDLAKVVLDARFELRERSWIPTPWRGESFLSSS
jgi:hypothetical protein